MMLRYLKQRGHRGRGMVTMGTNLSRVMITRVKEEVKMATGWRKVIM